MKISNTIHSAFSLFFLLSLSARLIQAETVDVAGYSFSSPSNWISSVPTSKMRKAQFKVPGEKGKDAEVAFFYFGGGGAGGVKANVDRWMSQFEDAKGIEVKNTTIGDTLVTYAQAHGTFLSGRAFGPKTPKPNYALLAAIISGKNGAIFIKMTGPKETVEAQVSNIKKMVLNSLDK
jgi:hypothetical protein